MADISKITPLGSSTTYNLKDNNAPRKDGTGATGTWGINISGSAALNVLKTGDTMTGQLYINKTNDVGGTTAPGTTAPFVLGAKDGQHIEMDSNEILSKTDGTTPGILYLQDGTGEVRICGSGGLQLTAGLLKVTKNSNTVTIGSQNANFCHIYNTASIPFIFNNNVASTNGDLGTTSYPWKLVYCKGVHITPDSGSWNEGVRIHSASSGYATVALCGTDNTGATGTSANTWALTTKAGNISLTRNGTGIDNTGTAYLKCVSNKWSISGNITSPSTNCTWIAGQNAANAAFNVGDATNTGSYWPWMRQTNTSSSKWFSFGTLNTKFYWIGSATNRTENSYDAGMSFDVANGYLQGCSRVYGAVWNDYAEYRITKNKIEPGRCVIETGNDDLILSTKRMQPGAEIVSDTFGFAIGETKEAKTPIASNGRVLAYPYESLEEFKKNIGRPVCSGPNGTISIMTDEEYQKYGYYAIGTISAVPGYEEWGTGKVKVNGRVWIRIR